MFSIADITQLREFIATEDDKSPEDAARILDRLDGYLAGMQFVAESREREAQARSDRAIKAVRVRKTRTPRVIERFGPGDEPVPQRQPRNGAERAPLRVGAPQTDDEDE